MAEVVTFAIFAAVAVAGGVVVITARNVVYSAMGLLAAMFSVAIFYVMLGAHFVAAVQVLIYAGAVMTLFLFVIFLIGVDRAEDTSESIPFLRPVTIVVGVGLLAAVLLAGRQAWVTGRTAFGTPDLVGTIEAVADELFGTWMLAFLGTVFLLTIAALGTVALAQFQRSSRPPLEAVPEEDPA